MSVTERHEQTNKALETLANCGRNPNVDGGVNIALLLSRQGGPRRWRCHFRRKIRRLVTQYGTSSKERNSYG
jgi:hypothetical protein